MLPTGERFGGNRMELGGDGASHHLTGSARLPAASVHASGQTRMINSGSDERLGHDGSPARAVRRAMRPSGTPQFKTLGRPVASAVRAISESPAIAVNAFPDIALRQQDLGSLYGPTGGEQAPQGTTNGARAQAPFGVGVRNLLEHGATNGLRSSQNSDSSTEQHASMEATASCLDGQSGANLEAPQRLTSVLNSIEQLQMPPPLTEERDRLYQVLGIPRDMHNLRQIRNAYLREICKYHPDRITALMNAYRRCSEHAHCSRETTEQGLERLENIRKAYVDRTQEIQLAFETISDPERRRVYDTFGYRCVRDRRLLNMILQLSDFIRCRSLKTRQLRERVLRASRNRSGPNAGDHASTDQGTANAATTTPYGFTGAGGPAYGWWDNGCSASIAERQGLDRCLHKMPCDTVSDSASQPEKLSLWSGHSMSSSASTGTEGTDRGDGQRATKSTSNATAVHNIVHELAFDLADFYRGRAIRVAIERSGFGLDGRPCREECALTIRVEPGMRDGDRVEFPGCGNAAYPGAEAGAVIFVLREKPHPRFTRVGDDLRMRKKLTLAEALCGFSFTLKLLDGRTIMVQSRDGSVTRPGTVKRIPHKGMPKRRRYASTSLDYGDLFIEFDVEWPRDGVIRGPAKEQLLAVLATISSENDMCKTRGMERSESAQLGETNRTSIESVRTIDEARHSFDDSMDDIPTLTSNTANQRAMSSYTPSAIDDNDDDDDDDHDDAENTTGDESDEDAAACVEEIVTAEKVRRLPPEWKACPRCHQEKTRARQSSSDLPRISMVTDASSRELSRSFSLDH